MRALLLVLFVIVLAGVRSGQGAEPPGKPKLAYVKVINASEVFLPEPWRAGVDLIFQDREIAKDIRAGESCPYREIRFTAKDFLSLRMSGTRQEAVRVPADFEKGSFYTLIIVGRISGAGASLKAIVRKDFPEESKGRHRAKNMARIEVINAIRTFPVAFAIGKGEPDRLQVGRGEAMYVPPGKQPLTLKFADRKGRKQIIRNSCLLEAGKSYTLIVRNSTEGGHRPVLLKSCETAEIQELIQRQNAAKAGDD